MLKRYSSAFMVTLLVVGCALFSLMGCEGEQGPTGDAGAAGSDGSAACGTCHNVSTTVLAKQIQWQASQHATGGNFERNDADCAECHTSEGFRQKIAGMEVTSPDNPTPQNCRTCHDIHKNYDATDFSLSTMEPVTLDISGKTVDFGKGNLCANCHQPRVPSPLPVVGGADVAITSGYWGPHYGQQAIILGGASAFEIAGTLSYENSAHTMIADGCTTCHMATPYGVQAGGHTMKMSYEYHGGDVPNTAGCNTAGCHTDIDAKTVKASQDEVQTLIDELQTKLLAAGLIDATDHVVPATMSGTKAAVVINYITVLKDHSKGVHNAKYTKALLQNSIDAL